MESSATKKHSCICHLVFTSWERLIFKHQYLGELRQWLWYIIYLKHLANLKDFQNTKHTGSSFLVRFASSMSFLMFSGKQCSCLFHDPTYSSISVLIVTIVLIFLCYSRTMFNIFLERIRIQLQGPSFKKLKLMSFKWNKVTLSCKVLIPQPSVIFTPLSFTVTVTVSFQ